jgi:uncharacterized protein
MSIAAHLPQLQFPPQALEAFCRKWKIVRLEAFGSVLRQDFGPQSDVDLLVTFAQDAQWSLIDHVRMEDELAKIFARPVDLLTRRGVEASENWIRRKAILSSAQTVWAA